MAQQRSDRVIRILLLNPNSSNGMTHGIDKAVRSLGLPTRLEVNTYTAPDGSPSSINNDKDLAASTAIVLSDTKMQQNIKHYDAILVACYSVHPLVLELQKICGEAIVLGIFESTILTALSLLPPYAVPGIPQQTWGIVTTGKFWEAHLQDGVRKFLGQSSDITNVKFAGVYSTGVDASDLHDSMPHNCIHERLKDATKQLLSSSNVRCVVMGCAGMAGLERIIRETALQEYGEDVGSKICIIDGAKAGISLLEQAIKARRIFQS